MKQPTFIKSLIEKYTERKNNKPKYNVSDLYYSSIENLLSIMSPYFNCGCYITTKMQDFAIFYKKSNGTYLHIKTGICLPSIQDANIGEWVVNDTLESSVKPLIKFFKKHNIKTITPETKITKNYIINLEDSLNSKQENNILNK